MIQEKFGLFLKGLYDLCRLLCEGKNLSKTRWSMFAKHKVVEVAKRKTGAGITWNTCRQWEIKILEIHVVALKSDATMYVSCIATKEKEGGSLKALNSWINSEFLCWGITESSWCISWSSAVRYIECLIKIAKKCLHPALCAVVLSGYPTWNQPHCALGYGTSQVS